MTAPRVLVYGDSNSWGFPPDDTGLRMDRDVRWPGVFAALTGAEVIEEALPGRTVDLADPEGVGAGTDGRLLMPAVLLSHRPLDLVLIMLGTNDLQAKFAREGADVAARLVGLAELARACGGAGRSRHDMAPAPVGLIAPPAPGARMADPAWDTEGLWLGAVAKARILNAETLRLAAARGIPAFDGARVATGAESDPVHMTEAVHAELGRAVADWVLRAFPEIWG